MVVIFVLLSVSTPSLQLGSMCAPTTITFPLFLILLALGVLFSLPFLSFFFVTRGRFLGGELTVASSSSISSIFASISS